MFLKFQVKKMNWKKESMYADVRTGKKKRTIIILTNLYQIYFLYRIYSFMNFITFVKNLISYNILIEEELNYYKL